MTEDDVFLGDEQMQTRTIALSRPDIACVAIMGLVAFATVLLSTVSGIGLSLDSFDYIYAAQNLVAGHGLNSNHTTGQLAPFTHFPPLYPLSLAALGLLGLEPLVAARWLNSLCFPLSVILIGLITRINLGCRFWLMGLSCFLVTTSINMIKVFSFALSEPLFITFVLGKLFFLSLYLKSSERPFLLVGAACASLALLTRYVGVAAVGTGFVALVALTQKDWRNRLSDLRIFAVISLFPISLYIARNIYVAGTAANRTVMFHAIPGAKFAQFIDTLAGWLVPVGNLPFPLKQSVLIAAVLVLASGLVWCVREWTLPGTGFVQTHDKRALLLVGTSIPAYIFSLVISLLFLDAAIPLNYRILAPLFPLCLVCVIGVLRRFLRASNGKRTIVTMATAACIVFSGIYFIQGRPLDVEQLGGRKPGLQLQQ